MTSAPPPPAHQADTLFLALLVSLYTHACSFADAPPAAPNLLQAQRPASRRSSHPTTTHAQMRRLLDGNFFSGGPPYGLALRQVRRALEYLRSTMKMKR